MKRLKAKILIFLISKNSREFNRLVRKFNNLYKEDRFKNKYRLYSICNKIGNKIRTQYQLQKSYDLLLKIP